MALALDTRKMAIEAIQADARDIKITIDTFGQDIRDTKDAIAGFVQNPLDATVQNLFILAATLIVKGLGSKKDQARPTKAATTSEAESPARANRNTAAVWRAVMLERFLRHISSVFDNSRHIPPSAA